MHEFRVSKGRLLFRNLAQRQTAIVGLLHLPLDFEVIEGAAYVLMLSGGQVSILAKPIDTGLPRDFVGQGIDVALRSGGWMGTAIPTALSVRFCTAWPEANIWTVYGASNHAMELVVGSNHDHAWFDLGAAGLTAVQPPADTLGQTMAQMLTSHAVWPGPQGELHTLPQHNLAWRPRYLEISKLHARCGAGEFDVSELQRLLAADPSLDRIRTWGEPDRHYLRYLAALDRAGGIEIERPRTAEEHEAREAIATRCIVEAGLMPT